MKRKPLSATLSVLSGLHEGVVQTLCPGAVRIGGGGGADLVLADGGLAAVHVEVEVSRGVLSLRALGTGVMLEGGGDVAAGAAAEAALPATFSVAGVRFRCDGPARRRIRLPSRGVLGAMTVLAGVLVSRPTLAPPLQAAPREGSAKAAAYAGDAISPAVTVERQAGDLPPAASPVAPSPVALRGAPPRIGRTALAAPAMDAGTAAGLLQAEAASVNLTGVRVSAQGSLVVAAGSVPPADDARWRGLREWFDRRTAGRVPLRNDVQVQAARPFTLQLDSVWTGSFANIVIGGSKYLEGSVLPNGWTLDRIEADRLVLHRGDQSVAVSF